MKQNIFDEICSLDNLFLAHKNAKKGKAHYRDVIMVEKNILHYINEIHQTLVSGKFKTSEYVVKTISDKGKQRTIHKLPYYPDRIIHHAIIQVVGKILEKKFIRHSFQSIPKRGCLDAKRQIEKHLKFNPSCSGLYYAKIDIKKFYPSVDNTIMKEKLGKLISCPKTQLLLYDIVDSCDGLPIGNYTSQYLGNFYLTGVDNYCKRVLKLKHYYRYCDDIVFLSEKGDITQKLNLLVGKLSEIKLQLSRSPVVNKFESGFDFAGYVFFPNKTLLRKRIKKNFLKVCQRQRKMSIPSYYGWCKHCNGHRLFRLGVSKLSNKNWRLK